MHQEEELPLWKRMQNRAFEVQKRQWAKKARAQRKKRLRNYIRKLLDEEEKVLTREKILKVVTQELQKPVCAHCKEGRCDNIRFGECCGCDLSDRDYQYWCRTCWYSVPKDTRDMQPCKSCSEMWGCVEKHSDCCRCRKKKLCKGCKRDDPTVKRPYPMHP